MTFEQKQELLELLEQADKNMLEIHHKLAEASFALPTDHPLASYYMSNGNILHWRRPGREAIRRLSDDMTSVEQ